jgi:hypothetical protein
MSNNYEQNYIKYKTKYLELKNQFGGVSPIRNNIDGTPKIFYYSRTTVAEAIAAAIAAKTAAAVATAAAATYSESLFDAAAAANATYTTAAAAATAATTYAGDIEKKIRVIYTIATWNSSAEISNVESEFFYIENENYEIIAIVKISNNIPGFEYELGFDFTLENYQKKGLNKLLLNHRIQYVTEKYRKQMYVCYTEYDEFKHYHSECGMTLCPSIKVLVGEKNYWRYEINRNFTDLITNNTSYGNCTGMEIGRSGNNACIFTARHCFFTGIIPLPGPFVVYKQIENYNRPNILRHQEKEQGDMRDSTENDMLIINTDIMHDISNIYVLTNSGELPDKYKLKWFGNTSNARTNIWNNEEIYESLGADTNNRTLADCIEVMANKEATTMENYKNWFRMTTGKCVAGDSGGPHGIFFDNDTKFAIVGITSQGSNKAVHRNPIRIVDIPFLNKNGILYNKAKFIPETGEIIITEQNIGPRVPPVPLIVPIVSPISPILQVKQSLTPEEISKLISFLENIMKIYHLINKPH